MLRSLFRAAPAVIFLFCSASFPFQEGSHPVLTTIRSKPAPRDAPSAPDIRVDSALVLIPAHVTNAVGAIVANLSSADFRITEDGVPQTITHFSLDDAPASIGLVYDCSGSMRGKMHRSAAAAEAFFQTANPRDEFFLVQVADRAKLTVPFAAGPDDILSHIERVKPFGRTALLDGLQVAMKQMKQARNLRKALVVLSDGGDNQSRRNVREVKAALLESDVQVYAMGLFDQDDRKRTSEERRGPGLLDELAAETGGRLYPVASLDELPAISERISNDVRTEYVLGYSPPGNNRDGKYHRVKLTVTSPDLHTYYRQGYYAPQQ
ncbi:MAG: VWA domain-containing protein [Bryobacteraceae bacterium]